MANQNISKPTKKTSFPNTLPTVKIVKEYFQLSPKPLPSELESYYRSIYFQQSKGSYQKTYSQKEKTFITNSNQVIVACLQKIYNKSLKGKTFLDLGSGEGWALKAFLKAGCSVTGVDYSDFGINKFNKKLVKYFVSDEIMNFVKKAAASKIKYDFINLTNVIEHVFQPEKLLTLVKNILSVDGILIVTFPNDFSEFQSFLLKQKEINHEFWIAAPDHISYFNKNSFTGMAKRLGYNPVEFCADFPIDLFLLNNHSNYIQDRTKGKGAHLARVDFINLIYKMNSKNATDLLVSFGNLGIGRNLTAYLKIDK